MPDPSYFSAKQTGEDNNAKRKETPTNSGKEIKRKKKKPDESRKVITLGDEDDEEDDDPDQETEQKGEEQNPPAKEGADADADNVEAETTWEFIEKNWPREDRPSTLLKKKNVAKLGLEKVMAYFKLFQEAQAMQKSDQTDGLVKDTKPKEKKFREATDDGCAKLHQARFCRYPLADPKEWFHKMPTKRREIYLSMPLDFCGVENQVADVTIKKLHKKSEVLDLKMFLSENVSVNNKARRETRTHNPNGTTSSVTEFNWLTPTSFSQAKEAVFNFASLNFYLWPMDPSGLNLLRIYNKFEWFPTAKDEKTRGDLITGFFNLAMRKIAHAALNLKCVPSHKELEDMLKEILTKNNISTTPPPATASQQPQNNNSRGFNNSYQRGRAGNNYNNQGYNQHNNQSQGKKQEPDFKGKPVCHDFNKIDGTVCSRQLSQNKDGCKAGNNFYYHRCSQWVAAYKDYCRGKHPRKDCRHR